MAQNDPPDVLIILRYAQWVVLKKKSTRCRLTAQVVRHH